MKSYKDTGYDHIDKKVESKIGLPEGLLSAIRIHGEKSNADQVSSAGAKSVYQVIPSTRNAILKKYGIDAYLSPENAAEAAGLLLKEGLDRNKGDISQAIGEYTGGLNRKAWGRVTKAYIGRVLDGLSSTAQASEMPLNNQTNNVTVATANPDLLARVAAWKASHSQNTSAAPIQESATSADIPQEPVENNSQAEFPQTDLASTVQELGATQQPQSVSTVDTADPALLKRVAEWKASQAKLHPTQEQIDAAKNHTFADDLKQTLAENPIGAKLAAFADPVTSLYQGTKQLFGADNKQDVENVKTIREANPGSALAGNVASFAVGGMAAPAINTVKGAAAVGGATGFLNPADSIKDRLVHAGVGAGAGAAGVKLANTASSYIANKVANKALEKSLNATRDVSLKDAVKSGYVVTPSLANAGTTARTIEGLTGSARMARTAMDTNQKVTNSLANEYLGLPKGTALSDDVIQSLKTPHNAVYEEVAQLPNTVIGKQTIKSISTGKTTTQDVLANGRDVLDKLKEARFDSKLYWNNFNKTGDPSAYKSAIKLDKQAAQLESDLEHIAAQNGQNDLVTALKSARKELAKIHTIDKVMNEATGDVDAIALSKLAQKGAPLDGAARKIANFGRAYSKIARVPADGNSAAFTAVDAGLMGGGVGSSNPVLAALPLGRVIGRSAVLSKPAQAAMANKSYGLNPVQNAIDFVLNNKYLSGGLTGMALQANK